MPAKKPKKASPPKPAPKIIKLDPSETLLAAGLRLLDGGLPAAQLTPQGITAEAGVKPALFAKYFPDFPKYLAGILRRLSEQVRAETLDAIGRKPPGRELIREGIAAYLNAILSRPALPELTLAMRANPACQEVTRERMSSMVMLATLQLKMAGVPNFDGLGRLGMAMLFEIAHAEYEARRALPEYRQTLDFYFVTR